MKKTFRRVALVSAVMSVLATPAVAEHRYQITDLGAGVIPSAINNNGDVVGTIISSTSGPEAFIYSGGVVTGLGQLGGTASWGLSINDSATIVGTICMDDVCTENAMWGLQRHGFMSKNGQVTDLMGAAGLLEGYRINNSGMILGRSVVEDHQQKMILYDSSNGNITDASQDHGKNTSLFPRSLNNLGEAVFIESYCGSYECSRSLLFSNGTVQSLPDDNVVAWDVSDINDTGEMVGTSGYYLRGVLYTQELTFLPNRNLLAFAPEAINNEGVMLGDARDVRLLPTVFTKRPIWLSQKPKPDLYSNPAIYEKSKIVILQDRLAKAEDQWVLEEVFDINDKGQIVGYGRKNSDDKHGFILTPASSKETR